MTSANPSPRPSRVTSWLTAGVVEDAVTVVAKIFDEADRRDPDHQRAWVALIDGANQQIDRINAEPDARGIDVTIVVDFVPLIEYLWGAAWCLFDEGDPAAEQFVRPRPEGSWPATPAESPPPSAAKPAVTAWTPTTSHLPGALAPRHAQQSHRDALWRDVPHLRMLRCEDA